MRMCKIYSMCIFGYLLLDVLLLNLLLEIKGRIKSAAASCGKAALISLIATYLGSFEHKEALNQLVRWQNSTNSTSSANRSKGITYDM